MTIYNYTLEHTIGSARGSIEAESKEQAEQKLRDQYEITHIDSEGQPMQIVIEKLDLEEVE